MSKGGGGGSQTVTQEIDPDVKAGYLTNLDYARDVANQMGTRQFAGFDPTYQMGEAQALAAGFGPGRQQLGTAGQLTQAAAGFTPQQMMAASAGPAAMTGAMGYGAATGQASSAGPAALTSAATANMGDINRYMNPFTQNVIDASMADLERGRQTAAQQVAQRAQAARAFGGSRQGVAEALSNREFAEQAGRTISGLRAQGFDTAANLMQQDVARQQQAALSNQAARNQMAQFNAGQGQQMTLANLGALNQAGQFGASAQNAAAMANQAARNQMAQFNAANMQQAGLANQAAGLQGAQFRLNAAQQLGQMGQGQTAADMMAAQTAMALGGTRQQLAQQQLDAQRNLGLERLGIMQSALGLQPANLGQSQTSPVFQNTGANVLGGALGGATLAPMLGLGAGLGAGAGALLGLI